MWDQRKTYKLKPIDALILTFGTVGVGCFVYGIFEPLQLTTTYQTISSDKIDAPIRIVHLTDLHCDGTIRTEKKLPSVVRDLHPDLILFTGDSADNRKGLTDFQNCMTEISKIAPLFGVYGNHDSRSGRKFDTFQNTGIIKLDSSSKSLDVKGNKVWIAGSPVDSEGFIADTLSSAPADEYSIFLFHYPEGIEAASARDIDLFLCGHTHGGQIRLPFYGALVTASSLGKQFEYGHYKVGKTDMNVSRGIGMTGIPVRFLAPPEVAVIDVVPSKQ
jgi:predicted MPP superfamily phosphohydrolase